MTLVQPYDLWCMGSIAKAWNELRAEVPDHVSLVAVSKTKPNEAVVEAYGAGARMFGENRVQELVGKHETLTHQDSGRTDEFEGLEWHQIGTLQRNKVKYIAPFVHLIHAVDQTSLLDEINKRAASHGRKQNILLQVHIAEEQSKFGFASSELPQLLEQLDGGRWPNVHALGLMGMATFTSDEAQVAREFSGLRKDFEAHGRQRNWTTLSMGMSGDWRIAVAEGSTMVRIGSSIFGQR